MTENKNNNLKRTPKDELRNKYANTFKLFDDEGPTVPVEITNVGKLNFNIKDLDPEKKKKEKDSLITKPLDKESQSININKKDDTENISSKFDALGFSMNSKLKSEQKKKN